MPLTRYLDDFPAPEVLHPFERALLELTVGEARYVTALERVAALRKPLSEVRPAMPSSRDCQDHSTGKFSTGTKERPGGLGLSAAWPPEPACHVGHL